MKLFFSDLIYGITGILIHIGVGIYLFFVKVFNYLKGSYSKSYPARVKVGRFIIDLAKQLFYAVIYLSIGYMFVNFLSAVL